MTFAAIAFLLGMAGVSTARAAETVWLSSLDVSKTVQDWGRPQVDQSVTGKPLSIGGRKFARGLGTHAISTLAIELDGGTQRFTALVGVDDDAGTNAASVVFRVVGDGRTLWKSGVMKLGQAPQPVDVNLKGIKLAASGGWRCPRRHQLRPRRLGGRPVRSHRREAADHDCPAARVPSRPSSSRPNRRPPRESTGPESLACGPVIRFCLPFRPRASGRWSSPSTICRRG